MFFRAGCREDITHHLVAIRHHCANNYKYSALQCYSVNINPQGVISAILLFSNILSHFDSYVDRLTRGSFAPSHFPGIKMQSVTASKHSFGLQNNNKTLPKLIPINNYKLASSRAIFFSHWKEDLKYVKCFHQNLPSILFSYHIVNIC